MQIENPQDIIDGSPTDRNIFILLIIAALFVLYKRRVQWRKVIATNRWLFIFLLYWLVSLTWSDFPFVSFKRLIKNLGQLTIMLIIATEQDPGLAMRALLARYCYLVLPVSVILIKYFPEFGRGFNMWTGEPVFSGVTTNKNELGAVCFVCGLFLIWEFLEMRARSRRGVPALVGRSSSLPVEGDFRGVRRNLAGSTQVRTTVPYSTDELDVLCRVTLLATVIWLLAHAESSTAIVCLGLGTVILVIMQGPSAKIHIRHFGKYALVFTVLLLTAYTFPGLLSLFVEQLDRDITLTGRTDVWADLLNAPINPLFGVGYDSFWLGPYAAQMWAKYYFHPIQAHNGYLETYLQGGLVGLGLLIILLITVGGKLKRDLLDGNRYATLRFSFFVVALFYNWTEAFFNSLCLIWLTILLCAITYSHQANPASQISMGGIFQVRTRNAPARVKAANMAPILRPRGV